MLGESVSLPVSMRFARHKPGSLKTHLNYGQLSANHVYEYLENHQKKQQLRKVSPAPKKRGGERVDLTLSGAIKAFEKNLLTKREFQKVKKLILGL